MGRCQDLSICDGVEKKNISQLALPNYSLINERTKCTEPPAKLGCHSGKTGQDHGLHDLYHCQAGASMAGLMKNQFRHHQCACARIPERVFLLSMGVISDSGSCYPRPSSVHCSSPRCLLLPALLASAALPASEHLCSHSGSPRCQLRQL